MSQPTFFSRISYQTRPSNKLQQAILLQIERYDNILTQEPETLYTLIDGYTQQANRTHHRCTPMRADTNRTYPEKEISSISVSGLVTISLHKVVGTFPKVKPEPVAEPAPPPPVVVAPAPPPVPPPAPVIVETVKPRIAVLKGRDTDKIERFEFWDKFSKQVQTLLAEGRIWNIYLDNLQIAMAEEYGGKKHLAY
jgi:hypothetical protein